MKLSINEARRKAQEEANNSGHAYSVLEDRVNGGYIVRVYSSDHANLPSLSSVVQPQEQA